MVRLQCPDCGTTIDAEPGQEARCPSCGFSATVPPDAAGPAPAAPAPYTARPFGAGGGSGGYPGPSGPVPGGYGQGPPQPPQGHGHPQQYPQGYAQPRTNGMCTASLVLGLVGFCVPVITSILAIVFGIIGKKQAEERNEKGEGMALTGIILGSIQLAFGLLWFLFFPVFIGGGFVEVATAWP